MAEKENALSREELFARVEKKLHYSAQVYPLGNRFENLPSPLTRVIVLDVTQVPGCHYGLKNVFVPIIKNLEQEGIKIKEHIVSVSPDTAILVEPSTGNGWVAFSDASQILGYEHKVIMPDGLPPARYRHPQGREVDIIKTPAEDYALGMPRQLKKLLAENPDRLARGEKIFVAPNHPVGAADITLTTMAELGKQLINQIGDSHLPLRVVVSMGNGASLCALGEYVKKNVPESRIVTTESFAYGGGFEQFASLKGLPGYKQLYSIDPANPQLMKHFIAYGSNAPIGIELPLQTRAMTSSLIDEYTLFTDEKILSAYKELNPPTKSLDRAEKLPNCSNLPAELIDTFGNTSLANIATASRFTNKNELVVAMVYDGRANYR